MRQAELFPTTTTTAAASVPGLHLEPDWITAADEGALLARADAETWDTELKRAVQVYGLGYGAAGPAWLRDIPDWLRPLGERLVDAGHLPRFPENAVVNSYPPGVGIGAHRDYRPFGPSIACVSLGSDVVIDFTDPDGTRVPVSVPARSLWVASGAARSKWMHGIAHRLHDVVGGVRVRRARRVSITFRTAAPGFSPTASAS